MEKYVFEAKTEEELILNALNELNVKEDELLYTTREETSGLLKKKKYIMEVVLKSDVLEFAKTYIKDIVEGMGLDVTLETRRTANNLQIKLHSENSSILIGKNGRTLTSLQTLVRQAVQVQTGMFVNIILDVENYKEKQHKNIEFLAKKLAREVQKTKMDVKMDSMNSFERRLVHEVLKDFKGIKTESEGEEPNRSVVIKSID
ncbi:MAG: KH domain-containing protein [Bacilli bacterium]|nr:KH domain-containing protein [Bacilli bacterium]